MFLTLSLTYILRVDLVPIGLDFVSDYAFVGWLIACIVVSCYQIVCLL